MRKTTALLALCLTVALAAPAVVRADNPVYTTNIYIDGIFGGDSQGRIQEVVNMLKAGDQTIMDLKVLSRNGYGKILKAAVIHQCSFPVNQAVLDASEALRVSIDGIWGGDSCAKIASQIATLKACDQKIVRVEVTSYNGYGKILGANIWHLSSFKYEATMKAATEHPAPAPVPPATPSPAPAK